MADISRFVPIVSGFVMLVGGALLATLSAHYVAVFGTVLVALGSAMISLGVSETRRLEQAKQLLAPNLEPVCYQFHEAIAQLRQATKDFRDGSIPGETAGELIAAHTSSLEEALRNLHAYSGVQSDRDRFRRRREQTHIGDDFPATVAPTHVAHTSRTARPDDVRAPETVACPNCGTEHHVLLGPTVGDSALVSCESCHLRFHVHRDRHGEAFTKPWGSGAGRELDFRCPACTNFRFRYTGEAQPRYCLECFALVEPAGDGAKVVRPPSPPTEATAIAKEEYGKSILECHGCSARTRAFALYKDAFWAVCTGCRKLIRAGIPEHTGLRSEVAPVSSVETIAKGAQTDHVASAG